MGAKDTVMKVGYLDNGVSEWFENLPECTRRNLEYQAEISFKAGVKEVVDELGKYDVFWRTISTTGRDYYIPLSLADAWQVKGMGWR